MTAVRGDGGEGDSVGAYVSMGWARVYGIRQVKGGGDRCDGRFDCCWALSTTTATLTRKMRTTVRVKKEGGDPGRTGVGRTG